MRWRSISLTWLAWAVLVLIYQELLPMRLSIVPGDRAVMWTEGETLPGSQAAKPTLNEPLLNRHVSWDSEFYLSIATIGYDDPAVASVSVPGNKGVAVSKNYAFLPFYPYVIKALRLAFLPFGWTPIAASTAAGVLVSLLGALAGALALAFLARGDEAEPAGDGERAAFYLLIFPMGFFMAQVYTEGLFVGLAFGALALARRRRWVWAALLACLATWTRAVGVLLVLPLAWNLLDTVDVDHFTWRPFPWHLARDAALALLPLAAFVAWRLSTWGQNFILVEQVWFGRGTMEIGPTLLSWSRALDWTHGNPQAVVYYGSEGLLILLAAFSCWAMRRQAPDLALFGAAVLLVSFFSGPAQSVGRYALAMPVIYMWLARMGRRAWFDRGWTLGSILWMGMLLALFSFDMWVN
jgi:hypothetical protein